MLIKYLQDVNLDESKFPIFFHSNWLKLHQKLEQNSNVFIYIDNENEIVIPIKISKIKFLKKANYLYTPLGFSGCELNAVHEKKVVDKFHSFISEFCDVVFPPQHNVNFKSIPTSVKYFKIGVIFIDLQESIEEIHKRINKGYHRQIKQASLNSVKIDFSEENLVSFYDIYKILMEKQNKSPESFNFFNSQKVTLKNKIICGKSSVENEIESAVFCLQDGKKCYYEYGATVNNPIYSGSNKLLFLKLIEELKKSGFEKLILGGYRENIVTNSKLEGIQTFKFRIGGQIQEGYHFIKVIRPLKYFIFTVLLKLKSKIQGRNLDFINLEGLEIYKS
jgi:lipid II:glycine glycyltransferase (peptidoglycan interpeptide bridge formation enzyme)